MVIIEKDEVEHDEDTLMQSNKNYSMRDFSF